MLATKLFGGLYGLFGLVHLGVVHQGLITNSCHGADAVRALCNDTLFVISMVGT